MKKLILFVFLAMSSSVFAEDMYLLKAKIGNHLFNDIFIYESCTPKDLKGSVTVPGMFTSRLESGECHYEGDIQHINFKIKVHENNEEYYVSYILSITAGSISGTMIMNGELMGTFEGQLIYRGQ